MCLGRDVEEPPDADTPRRAYDLLAGRVLWPRLVGGVAGVPGDVVRARDAVASVGDRGAIRCSDGVRVGRAEAESSGDLRRDRKVRTGLRHEPVGRTDRGQIHGHAAGRLRHRDRRNVDQCRD